MARLKTFEVTVCEHQVRDGVVGVLFDGNL
jgi:hypothetical protein